MRPTRLLLLVLLALPLFGTAANYETQNPERTEIECVQASFTAEIGVRELTGRNDGIAVEKYQNSIDTDLGEKWAWCAAFINWNFLECGIETPKNAAWSPNWFPPSKVIYHRGVITANDNNYKKPRTSDVFGIYFSSKKRVAHVGYIDQWPAKKYFVTVEGNTNSAGSREGDGVYKKFRLKKQIYQVSRWTS